MRKTKQNEIWSNVNNYKQNSFKIIQIWERNGRVIYWGKWFYFWKENMRFQLQFQASEMQRKSDILDTKCLASIECLRKEFLVKTCKILYENYTLQTWILSKIMYKLCKTLNKYVF